jgi:hypothetical protein
MKTLLQKAPSQEDEPALPVGAQVKKAAEAEGEEK